MIDQTKLTGAIIGLLAAVATLLQLFGIVLPTTEIGIVLTAIVSAYGAIHQIVVIKSANKQAVAAGVMRK